MGIIAESRLGSVGSQLWQEYDELVISLFWQKDESNSHLALREFYLSHKTLKETIKKMHLL